MPNKPKFSLCNIIAAQTEKRFVAPSLSPSLPLTPSRSLSYTLTLRFCGSVVSFAPQLALLVGALIVAHRRSSFSLVKLSANFIKKFLRLHISTNYKRNIYLYKFQLCKLWALLHAPYYPKLKQLIAGCSTLFILRIWNSNFANF